MSGTKTYAKIIGLGKNCRDTIGGGVSSNLVNLCSMSTLSQQNVNNARTRVGGSTRYICHHQLLRDKKAYASIGRSRQPITWHR